MGEIRTSAKPSVNNYIQTLIYCKYTGSAIAKVWAGQAHLPTRETMWSRFWDQVHERGGLNEQLQWLVNLGMYCEFKGTLVLHVWADASQLGPICS